MAWIDNRFEQNIVTTTVDTVFNWARKSALWPMTFGSEFVSRGGSSDRERGLLHFETCTAFFQ